MKSPTSCDLHQGMKNRSPSASDASTKPHPEGINKDPVRTATAPSPHTLGPRTA